MAPVDLAKLRSHVDFVRQTVGELEHLRGAGREAFLRDEVSQAAATRWLQTAVEAMIDIANHVIAREGLGVTRVERLQESSGSMPNRLTSTSHR